MEPTLVALVIAATTAQQPELPEHPLPDNPVREFMYPFYTPVQQTPQLYQTPEQLHPDLPPPKQQAIRAYAVNNMNAFSKPGYNRSVNPVQ